MMDDIKQVDTLPWLDEARDQMLATRPRSYAATDTDGESADEMIERLLKGQASKPGPEPEPDAAASLLPTTRPETALTRQKEKAPAIPQWKKHPAVFEALTFEGQMHPVFNGLGTDELWDRIRSDSPEAADEAVLHVIDTRIIATNASVNALTLATDTYIGNERNLLDPKALDTMERLARLLDVYSRRLESLVRTRAFLRCAAPVTSIRSLHVNAAANGHQQINVGASPVERLLDNGKT